MKLLSVQLTYLDRKKWRAFMIMVTNIRFP